LHVCFPVRHWDVLTEEVKELSVGVVE
jgi:hypothetical protein